MTATEAATEHRLRLVGGGSVATNKTAGYPLVLIVSEGGKGFQAIDVADDEIDLIIELLRGAKE